MILDAHKQAVEAVVSPSPELQRTLKEILSDKKDSELFDQMLRTEHADNPDLLEVGVRMHSGTLTPEDLDLLDRQRTSFLEKSKKAKEVVEHLTPDMIEKFSKGTAFENMVKTVGKQGVSDAIKKQLYEFAFRRPDEFTKVAGPIGALSAYREGAYKKLDESTAKLLEKTGVSEDTFSRILQMPTEKERIKALRTEIKSTYGGARKAIDFVFGSAFFKGSAAWARELSGKKPAIDAAFQTLDTHSKSIVNALNGVVRDTGTNPEFMKALTEELLSTKGKAEAPQGMSFKEMKSSQKPWDEEKNEVMGRWNTFKTDPVNNFMGDPDAARDAFANAEKSRKMDSLEHKPWSLWRMIIEALFNQRIESLKTSLA